MYLAKVSNARSCLRAACACKYTSSEGYTQHAQYVHDLLVSWYRDYAYLAGTAAFEEAGNGAVMDRARCAACACHAPRASIHAAFSDARHQTGAAEDPVIW